MNNMILLQADTLVTAAEQSDGLGWPEACVIIAMFICIAWMLGGPFIKVTYKPRDKS